jgi:alpha-tubulin suppressor-like RCC1 family protein
LLIGNSTLTDQPSPIILDSKVFSGKNITQIAAGSYHAAALTSDGQLYHWGGNQFGQCGKLSLQFQSI